MLLVLVGVLAAALVAAGVAIMAGPALPRFWRAAWALAARTRRPSGVAPPELRLPAPAVGEPALHPTSARALGAAARAYSLLRARGEDRVAFELRAAARLVRSDEAKGLIALAAALRSMREVALGDEDADVRYRRLLHELREAVKDRSEQLELLHFQ
jgi:hypothetical protein